MQFARAEIPGLDDMMAALRKKVKANGPYQFIKLPHHTSYNGLDATVLTEWSDTSVFIHSGGSNDPRHPEKGALALLKAREKEIVFLRTDRSGPVTVSPAGVDVPEAEANDFSVNRPPDSSTAPPAGVLVPVAPLPPPPVWTTPQTSSPHEGADQQVEVITRVPHTATEVTVTIRVEPGVKKKFTAGDLPGGGPSPPALPPPAPGEREIRLGGGRPLPKLLFVTCRPQLELNLGQREADAVVRAIGDARPVVLFDLPRQGLTAAEAAAAVRQVLHGAVREGAPFAGVVLVGGYDVVPAHRLDVLDAATRRRLKATQTVYNDDDDFVVWSDDPYADLDEDLLPDLPVSRLADGRRADVLLGALQARTFTPGRRFGVRNLKRDFAAQVFPGLPGDGGRLEVSEAFGPDRFPPGEGVGAVYYMLHGRHDDTSRFWGEEQSDEPIGEQYEAVAVRNVPAAAPGTVVFTGCCWGGLTVTPPAGRAAPDSPFQLLGPEVSIALAYLRAGAVAFIGCTGSHYSPTTPDPDYEFYGKPLHDAFWAALRAGKPPAEALFLAKQAFGQKMPHGRRDVYQLAVELKTFRQFTCLGLGW